MFFNTINLPTGGYIPNSWGDKEQITHTYYDSPPKQALEQSMPNQMMTNLRNRVAYAEYYDTEAQLDAGNGGVSGSYYSYDVLGNCLLYTSPSPRDRTRSRMPSSA